jgi:predicted P-loop ATPase
VATECPNLGIKTLRRELATQQQIVDRKKRASATEQPEPTNEIALQFKKVERLLGKRLRLNTLTQQIELDGKPFPMRRWRLKLATEHDIGLKREDVEEFIRELAERNAYSPVAEYLEAGLPAARQ